MDWKNKIENGEFTLSVGNKVIAKSDTPFTVEEVTDILGYSCEVESIDASSLRSLAMFLEGYVKGKGDCEPFGSQSLESLWKAVKYFQVESNINKRKNEH